MSTAEKHILEIAGTGATWAVATVPKFGPLVSGEVVGITTLILTGTAVANINTYLFSGQHTAAELETAAPVGGVLEPLPQTEWAYKSDDIASPTVSTTIAVDDVRLAQAEPFRDGLTCALRVKGATGAWTAQVAVSVRCSP